MKKLLLATICLISVACGSQEDSSHVSTSSTSSAKIIQPDYVKLVPVNASVFKTLKHSVNGEKATKVLVDFHVGCFNTLTPVQFDYKIKNDGSIDLIYAAFEQVNKFGLNKVCKATVHSVRRTLVLPLEIKAEQIRLIRAASDVETELPQDFIAALPLKNSVRISQVTELCPPNMTCITNGTVIELAVSVSGCMDQAAVSHIARKAQNGQGIELSVAALNLSRRQSMVTMCIAPPIRTATITLIGQSFSQADIELSEMPFDTK